MSRPRIRLRTLVVIVLLAITALVVLGGSIVPTGNPSARVRAFTRAIEFDFVDWTLDALVEKGRQLALSAVRYVSEERQSQLVLDYLDLIQAIHTQEREVASIYANPEISDPDTASEAGRAQLSELEALRAQLEPLAETILQSQLQTILTDEEFALGGQSLPPVLYRTTPSPLALIVSPRDVIRRDHHLSIDPTLTTDELESLEAQIDAALDVSSLAVNVGGIGLYPTLVVETADINRLTEVVAHEWIHNFLTLRPLGAMIFETPQLTTINETVASIAGVELGRRLVERYYPDHLPPPPAPPEEEPPDQPPQEPPPFDFRREMGETRRNVDELLAEGKVEEAEAYMEARRQFFWDNGYRLRKLNQAYFAFYGSYADQPGGAAGPDPVGEAVRALRAQSDSLADFVKRVSWITSFEGLQELVGTGETS